MDKRRRRSQSRKRGRSGLKSPGGKIILALTAAMLVQHGVRHLLMADDPSGHANSPLLPLLDAYHPFPGQPDKRHQPIVDQTPVHTQVTVKAGQTVAIGSLDRSIRLHPIQIQVSEGVSETKFQQDSTWFDVSTVPNGGWHRPSKTLSAEKTQTPATATPRLEISAPADQPPIKQNAPQNNQHAAPHSARRFHLPFFRQGQVYERPLLTHLILHSDVVAIYGDPDDERHLEVALAIQACGLANAAAFIQSSIGPITDVDFDHRLSLVLGQLADPISPDSDEEPIRGCVRPADFQPGREMSTDVIYLDPAQLQVADLQSLLAHEMAHAATFSLLVKSGQTPTAMPGWLNEAIAHFIEERVTPESQNLLDRRRLFTAAPSDYPSIIPDRITGMKLRRGPVRIASLELLKSALTSHPDHDLQHLITTRGDGINRMTTVTEAGFPELFRQFTLHLMQQRTQAAESAHHPIAATLQLTESASQTLNLRGTAVAISSPVKTDCQLTVTTTRDAMLQITIVETAESELAESQ